MVSRARPRMHVGQDNKHMSMWRDCTSVSPVEEYSHHAGIKLEVLGNKDSPRRKLRCFSTPRRRYWQFGHLLPAPTHPNPFSIHARLFPVSKKALLPPTG